MSQLLEDAEYPDLDPAYYADEEPDSDEDDDEDDDDEPGTHVDDVYVVKAAALLVCATPTRNIKDAARFDSRGEAIEAARRGCTAPGCMDRHTVIFRDEHGGVRAEAVKDGRRRNGFTPTGTYVPGDLLTEDELDLLAEEEHAGLEKARRRAAGRKHGPYTYGAAALSGNSALTAATASSRTEPVVDLTRRHANTGATGHGQLSAKPVGNTRSLGNRVAPLPGHGQLTATAVIAVTGPTLGGSGSLSATAHPPRRRKGTGGICWNPRDGWTVTVYRPTADSQGNRQWRKYSQSYDDALSRLEQMQAQVAQERPPAKVNASLTGSGALAPRRRRRRRGQGSLYFRQGYKGRSGQWVAALDRFIGGERVRRVRYAHSEAEAEAMLEALRAEMQMEADVAELKARFNA
jgi:hypothetical protein